MSQFTLLGKEAFRAPAAPIAPPPANTGEEKSVTHYVWIKGAPVADGIPLWYFAEPERVVTTLRRAA